MRNLKMRNSIFSILLAGVISLVSASPKGSGGGGGKGGGGGGQKSGSFSCPTCKSDLSFMYGHQYTSVFTSTELIAQASLYALWMLILLGFYLRLRKTQGQSIRLAVWSFLICFLFLVVRYGLLLGGSTVTTGYRAESSIVMLFWKLGLTILFVAISAEIHLGTIARRVNILLNILFAVFNLTHVILDFLISEQAVDHFTASKQWWLSDRDFALTLDGNNIQKLVISGLGGNDGPSPQYIKDRMFDISTKKFLHDRGVAIKIGLITDLFALAIAALLFIMATIRFLKRKTVLVEYSTLPLAAASGLLVTATFHVIITAHFVLYNWGVVTNPTKWSEWVTSYTSLNVTTGIFPPDGFLNGYRLTIQGFPIVQAIIEPLGVVVACVAIILVVAKQYRCVANNEEVGEEEVGEEKIGEEKIGEEEIRNEEVRNEKIGGEEVRNEEVGNEEVGNEKDGQEKAKC